MVSVLQPKPLGIKQGSARYISSFVSRISYVELRKKTHFIDRSKLLFDIIPVVKLSGNHTRVRRFKSIVVNTYFFKDFFKSEDGGQKTEFEHRASSIENPCKSVKSVALCGSKNAQISVNPCLILLIVDFSLRNQ